MKARGWRMWQPCLHMVIFFGKGGEPNLRETLFCCVETVSECKCIPQNHFNICYCKKNVISSNMHVNVAYHGVLTTVGGAVLALWSSRLLFLLSSSLTGSLTRTPWYGLGLVSADGGAREAGSRQRETDTRDFISLHLSRVGSLRCVCSDCQQRHREEFEIDRTVKRTHCICLWNSIIRFDMRRVRYSEYTSVSHGHTVGMWPYVDIIMS